MICLLAAAAVAAGCKPPSKPVLTQEPAVQDACAERLHDMCGQLLLYWSTRGRLPERLENLSEAGGPKTFPPPLCPVCKKPYAYNPDGLPLPDTSRRVLVYDSEPCHDGMRWVIAADPAGPGKPLVLRVLRLPNDPKIFAPAAK